jgi:biopolymer transport protein ExbD
MGMTTAGSREINVTPLIDVLLVLLIIFLVMMPIMLRFETVQVPPHNDDAVQGVTVTVKLQADQSVVFDDGPAVPRRELWRELRKRMPNVKVVFVDFVDGVPWSDVLWTVDSIHGVGTEFGLPELPVAVRLHRDDDVPGR